MSDSPPESYVPPEPLPDDVVAGYKRLSKEFLELHQQMHQLRQSVNVEHEDWLHTHEERLDGHDKKFDDLLGQVKDGQTVTLTVARATARQLAALSRKLGVPIDRDLAE